MTVIIASFYIWRQVEVEEQLCTYGFKKTGRSSNNKLVYLDGSHNYKINTTIFRKWFKKQMLNLLKSPIITMSDAGDASYSTRYTKISYYC